jgi:hypothetical protein
VTATPGSDATELTIYIVKDTTGTAYADAARAKLAGYPIYRLALPTSFLSGPHKVFQQEDENRPTGNYYALGTPVAGRNLRMVGKGLLSRPTTEAGTTEVGAPRDSLIVAKAAELLARGTFFNTAEFDRDRYRLDRDMWKAEVAELLAQPGMVMRGMGAQMSDEWKTEEDSSGRYLVLTKEH